jgi:hypothetical protein
MNMKAGSWSVHAVPCDTQELSAREPGERESGNESYTCLKPKSLEGMVMTKQSAERGVAHSKKVKRLISSGEAIERLGTIHIKNIEMGPP